MRVISSVSEAPSYYYPNNYYCYKCSHNGVKVYLIFNISKFIFTISVNILVALEWIEHSTS